MHFKMSSAICFNLDRSNFLSSGNGLKKSSAPYRPKALSNSNTRFLVHMEVVCIFCIWFTSTLFKLLPDQLGCLTGLTLAGVPSRS